MMNLPRGHIETRLLLAATLSVAILGFGQRSAFADDAEVNDADSTSLAPAKQEPNSGEADLRSIVIQQLVAADPIFGKYVDWALLETAMNERNAASMADAALGMSEAERILLRQHNSGITSERLFQKAVLLAIQTDDTATQERLKKAAERINKAEFKSAIDSAKTLKAATRAAGPAIALRDVSPELALLNDAVAGATSEAALTNDKGYLESLRKEVADDQDINKEQKQFLLAELDTAISGTAGDADATEQVLQQLSGPSRGNINVMYRKHWSGLTYGQLLEQFSGAIVFPKSLQYTFKGITVGVDRKNVIAERFESNGRGGYYLACRAKYEGYVRILGKKIPVGADRVRYYYDNGGIRVDLAGCKGALNTRSIGQWVKDKLPKKL